VRLAAPRFFTLGDTTYVSTIIHNYTDRKIDAKVSLEADGVTLNDKNERTVSLAPGGQASLDWKVKCDEVGIARFTASVKSGKGKRCPGG